MKVDGNAAFRAMSDPIRRQILVLLADEEMSVTELDDQLDVGRASIRRHLTSLEKANMISTRSAGRQRINQLNPAGLVPVMQWLNEFDRIWDERLAGRKSTVVRRKRRK